MERYQLNHEFCIEGNTLEGNVNSIALNQRQILENQQAILQSIEKMKENNLNALSKIAATLDQLQRKNRSLEGEVIFPIKSLEKLKSIDELCRDDAARYIQCIKPIISPEGIGKNFHRLIDKEMIQLLNYDGVSNKAAFKDFTFLNSALFEAVKHEGYTTKEYVKDIRNAFKLYKNLYYKKRYEEKKKCDKKH